LRVLSSAHHAAARPLLGASCACILLRDRIPQTEHNGEVDGSGGHGSPELQLVGPDGVGVP
jgi:hypothetical protein